MQQVDERAGLVVQPQVLLDLVASRSATVSRSRSSPRRRRSSSSWARCVRSLAVLLWEVPPTARKPDAVLHRYIPDGEQLMARHVLITVEVLSTWSARRDRVHKMSDYAGAGGGEGLGALRV